MKFFRAKALMKTNDLCGCIEESCVNFCAVFVSKGQWTRDFKTVLCEWISMKVLEQNLAVRRCFTDALRRNNLSVCASSIYTIPCECTVTSNAEALSRFPHCVCRALPPGAIKVSWYQYLVYIYVEHNSLVEVPCSVSRNGSIDEEKPT